jgi:hypothetical protein
VGSAHSPGPWRYERRDGDRYIYAADGESLQCDMDYYPWVSANEADWPLIAAAPELLEALRNLREAGNTLRLAEQDGINVHGAMSAYIGARDMADVVIAKATGEQ